MRIGVSAFAERLRGSLFVIPMTFVLIGIVLGQLGIALDQAISDGTSHLPLGMTSTVESARAVLSTVAAATITVAGISFSVSLLTIQLASSQYSPRIVSGLFRDPFNKRVIGLVVGTFAYCLVVLRSVRSAIEQQGEPVVPNISVAFAVLLGIAAILAIIAFIDHNAHSMDISKILDDVTGDAIEAVDRHWSTNLFEPSPIQQPDVVPEEEGLGVTFDRDGWVQLLDHVALVELVPEGGTVRLDTAIGRYAISGSPLCTLWPVPTDIDKAVNQARATIHTGETRTLQQDASYGVRQIVDVALKALSPGVNDPTTAQDAIFHLAAVVRAFLEHDPPAQDVRHGNRRLVLIQAARDEQLVALAYDEIRRAAAPQPMVSIYLLESISLVKRSLASARRQAVTRLLDRQAQLVMDGVVRTDISPPDLERVERVYQAHFGAEPEESPHPEGRRAAPG